MHTRVSLSGHVGSQPQHDGNDRRGDKLVLTAFSILGLHISRIRSGYRVTGCFATILLAIVWPITCWFDSVDEPSADC